MRFHLFLLLIFYFPKYSICQDSFIRYLIKDIGTIDISSKLELQEGILQEITDNVEQKIASKLKYEIISGKITFQQKGLNKFSKESLDQYARITILANIETPGRFEKIQTKIILSPSELETFDATIKKQFIDAYGKIGMKVTSWDTTKIVEINNISATKVSYKVTLFKAISINVETYQFQNYDREHVITFSYNPTDIENWGDIFDKTINSLIITNRR